MRTNSGSKPGWAQHGLRIGGLAMIATIGVVLRHHHFHSVETWFDESLGWRMAQFSPTEIIERSARNVHPPAHFLLLSFWRRVFGSDLTTLRYYALLWGVLTTIGGALLAMEATDAEKRKTWSGLLACSLIAGSSLHIHWSHQVKMYTLGTCLAMWTSLLLASWFREARAWKLVVYVPLAATLTLQHHYGTFTVFAQLSFAVCWVARRFIAGDRTHAFPVLLTGWATTAIWSLWLPSFLAQRQLVKSGYWIDPFRWSDVLTIWGELFVANSAIQLNDDVYLVAGQVVFVLMLLMFAIRKQTLGFVAWISFLPWAIAVVWSVIDQNVLVSRFLIYSHVCFLVGVSVLVTRLPATPRIVISMSLLIATLVPVYAQRQLRKDHASLPGLTAALEYLQLNRLKDEPCVVCNPMLYLNTRAQGEYMKRLYAVGSSGTYPHFQGTPVMKDGDYLPYSDLYEFRSLWTLDAEQWLGETWGTPLPHSFSLVEEKRFRAWYATIVVRRYCIDEPETTDVRE